MTGTGWLDLAMAFVLFLASHSLPARPAVRSRLVAALGEAGYLVLYSAVSLLALTWLIVAAGRAAVRRGVGVCTVAAVGAEPGDAGVLLSCRLRHRGPQCSELWRARSAMVRPR